MKKKINFEPKNGYFLVDWVEPNEKTQGGIILPEQLRQNKGIVEVLAVDTSPEFNKLQLKPGDWVLLGDSGILLDIEGKKYGLVKEYQVWGVFPNKPSDDTGVLGGEASVELKLDKTKAKADAFAKKVMS